MKIGRSQGACEEVDIAVTLAKGRAFEPSTRYQR